MQLMHSSYELYILNTWLWGQRNVIYTAIIFINLVLFTSWYSAVLTVFQLLKLDSCATLIRQVTHDCKV